MQSVKFKLIFYYFFLHTHSNNVSDYKWRLTVCRSRLKMIKVIKPVNTAKGIKLIRAKNFPNPSPESKKIYTLKTNLFFQKVYFTALK